MAFILGTPLKPNALRVMLLGSGELGKEVMIELQRLGVETIAVDSYGGAPAHQVAHRHHVIDMLDGEALRYIIEKEKPHIVVPEVEAISTPTLIELEKNGLKVIPTANAAWLTMNREGIRRLVAEELKLPTSRYEFAGSWDEFQAAAKKIGIPCFVKPIMSSSGKGQSFVKSKEQLAEAWDYAVKGGRGKQARVIVESPIEFDYEITLLTVSAVNGVLFCDPIGHVQIDGDYRESWQPHPMAVPALERAKQIASQVVKALGGYGVFGVELFVKGDEVWFSEVSPRPHDTGMVTMVTQNLSEFAIHARALLGLPLPEIRTVRPGASAVVLADKAGQFVTYHGLDEACAVDETQVRVFGKPNTRKNRRMAVALSTADDTDTARQRAKQAAACIRLVIED
ncbi:formate-dependent phosphoribosylglycinamide formyltransferase [Oscillatoria amoena NRMC-F 0135]|nr:formate-dependent phosphoribosylglycinamide formyltransferase [Oscillatoria amoena NRMC-F 0135]